MESEIRSYFDCKFLHTKKPYWDGKSFTNDEYGFLIPKLMWICPECYENGFKDDKAMENDTFKSIDEVVLPENNEFKFHGTMEEFKKYLPEMYEKYVRQSSLNELKNDEMDGLSNEK